MFIMFYLYLNKVNLSIISLPIRYKVSLRSPAYRLCIEYGYLPR